MLGALLDARRDGAVVELVGGDTPIADAVSNFASSLKNNQKIPMKKQQRKKEYLKIYLKKIKKKKKIKRGKVCLSG